ncbi:MAG: D-sedoheptulose 7-phosphate isomerase [Chloroflexi bacterium]|nr:D-sedoheptulose 7-phosphate isomerase [Chloroflexota bacterium]
MLTSAAVKSALAEDLDEASAVAARLVEALMAGNKLMLFGNGGSAADSQHIAAELTGRYYIDRPAMAALALTVDTSALTAIGNDFGFDRLFARQIEGLGKPGDVAIGLTTSGNSRNVVAGLEVARDLGLVTVAMTGAEAGRAGEIADYAVRVPSSDTPRIQESHILLGHAWSEIVEAALYRPTS